MRKYRLLGMISILLMLSGCFVFNALYQMEHSTKILNSYARKLGKAPLESDPMVHIREDFSVEEDFSSHLPIVILDTGGVEPPINTYENAAEERFVAIEGLDPYVDGNMYIINTDQGINFLTDEPEVVSRMRIKRRGNSSMLYEKAQWLVKLVAQDGLDRDVDVLGMGEEHEWILNGSMFDKSLLRNYLAYSIASEFMPYTPDSRYCEVLIKENGKYQYQGVYLLCENIKRDENRVNISKYDTDKVFSSYLVRRDRLDETGNMLDTYGRWEKYSKEYFELLYPNKKIADETVIRYVEKDLSEIEEVLYSEDEKIFSRYPDVIDVDSFVDYFLLNEFFGSYDSGNYSTYCYKELGGKLKMGPVWDYDGTMDNYAKEALDTDAIAFQTKPWFDRLCKDQRFIDKLQKRYIWLRHTALSEAHITEKIDEITAHLGGAQERDWYRWGHWYTTQNKYSLQPEKGTGGQVLIRNAVTYQDEIYRIKTALREHGEEIPQAVETLKKTADKSTGIEDWMGWLLLLSACVFFLPAVYVSQKK